MLHLLSFVYFLFATTIFTHAAPSVLEDYWPEEERANQWASDAPTNWAQPPVGCVEELLPNVPDRACLDLTEVTDPARDFPELSPEEKQYWVTNRRQLQYCRAKELLRREAQTPGTITAGQAEVSWMQTIAVEKREQKLAAVTEASRTHRMPPQVLTGALFQESLFAELGVAADGDNYSCGLGQINVREFCRWANTQSAKKRNSMNWKALNCGVLDTTMVKPFYEIAKTRLGDLPEYRLVKEHFRDISLADVVDEFPPASSTTQKQRYQAIRSFLDNCMDVRNGIAAKANELAALYETYVPTGMKQQEQYKGNDRYQRACHAGTHDRTYPLHSGWLLAVAAYNAGPRVVDALAHYRGWKQSHLDKPKTWDGFAPTDLVEAFYWTGRHNKTTDRIDYTTRTGGATNWLWFKACVVQRHVARVVQHVTLPGVPPLADTLEGAFKCAKSTFDENGNLLKSAVPPHRQTSSGVKEKTRAR